MWKNYFLTALRSFKKGKLFALINIFGLGTGFAAALFIFLNIYHEINFDQFHKNADRIYREINIGSEYNDPIHPGVFMEFQKNEIIGVEAFTMIRKDDIIVNTGDAPIAGQSFLSVDTNFFDVFTWDGIEGNVAASIRKPNSIILTATAAKKYFGNKNAIGEKIVLDNDYTAYVDAVIADVPMQSFVHFEGILPLHFIEKANPSSLTQWTNSSFHFFCLLYPNVEPDSVSLAIENCWEKNHPNNSKIQIKLQKLKNIHLFSENIRWEIEHQSSITNVRILGITAMLILLLACINFINLSTARNSKRYKEIGLRKTLGSSRNDIIIQFMLETALYIVFSLLFAFTLFEILHPIIATYTAYTPNLNVLLNADILPYLLIIIIMLIVLAGSYPAFILSSYSPTIILKGVGDLKSNTGKKIKLKELLVLFQFIITISLLTGAFIVQSQFQFLINTKPGFDKAQKIVITNPWDDHMHSRFEKMSAELANMPSVKASCGTHNIPGRFQNNYSFISAKGYDSFKGVHTAIISVSPNFFNIMGAEIKDGQNFSQSLSNTQQDSLPYCIINESFANILKNNGIEKAIGENLSGFWDIAVPRKIIGIVKDIHFRSMHNKVFPTAFIISRETYPNYTLNLIVDMHAQNMAENISQIEKKWSEIAPQWPFEYLFLDQEFGKLYEKEKRLSGLIKGFTLLAFLISLIGLLSIVAISFQSKTREIGIRKILGASQSVLIRLLTWHFLKLVLLANIISLPLIWFLANLWLNNFAYHIDLHWWIFALSALVSLSTTFCIVYWQSLHTMRINPMKVLKYE